MSARISSPARMCSSFFNDAAACHHSRRGELLRRGARGEVCLPGSPVSAASAGGWVTPERGMRAAFQGVAVDTAVNGSKSEKKP